MEIKYPYIMIILIMILIFYLIVSKKNIKYTTGSKIANTFYLKNTNYYKKKIRQYKVIKYISTFLFISAFITSILLISRITKETTYNSELYNRDIFLCMDVSSSVDELNIELVDSLKNMVRNLHQERFGISIFNTSSVTLVPLTDDYEYVINTLNEIKNSIRINNSEYEKDDDNLYAKSYIYSGTIERNKQRGSSLIGDGLASCIYNFNNTNKDRTKIIIFSTDNNLSGTPLLSLEDAINLGKNKGIKIFGIASKNIEYENKKEFQNLLFKSNEKYYDHSESTTNSIINDIEKTSKSQLKINKTRNIDTPEIPFIILLISIIGLIYISKKVEI